MNSKRRDFLKKASMLGAGLVVAPTSTFANPASNETEKIISKKKRGKINIAFIAVTVHCYCG